MKRNINIDEVSDGKLYTANDMVRLGCNDCEGCSACCRNMESVILDPYDVYMMTTNVDCTFDELLYDKIELGMMDNVILPRIRMDKENNACGFLNEAGRCAIHSFRPGICRLFPLGRIYDGEGFRYWLQVDECKKKNRTKVKISKWLQIPDMAAYEKYINDWHSFVKGVGADVGRLEDQEKIKQIGLSMLNLFFRLPYDADRSFYEQFYERMNRLDK